VGDCDDDVLFVKNQGEFAYEVTYSLEEEDVEFTASRKISSTSFFSLSDGEVLRRNDGENIQMGNKDSVSFVLLAARRYQISFTAIEWDGSDPDTRMDHPHDSITVPADGEGGEFSITLGREADCRVKLLGNSIETVES